MEEESDSELDNASGSVTVVLGTATPRNCLAEIRAMQVYRALFHVMVLRVYHHQR